MTKYANESLWIKMKSPFGTEEYIPKLIDINPEQFQFYYDKAKRIKCLLLTLLFLCLFILILLLILLPFLLMKKQDSIETTTTTTTTRIPSSISVSCIYPLVLSLTGNCVNVLIDSLNCGSIGNVCRLNLSCSAGECANVPGIQLNQSISIWSSAINGSADDQMYLVDLPWSVSVYNRTTNSLIVTTDGVICFSNCSTTYTESELPSDIFSDVTLFPFWDDLYIYANTSQGIYYESQGNSPSRLLLIEFYMSHYVEEDQFYHFQVRFFENQPGIVEYRYFDATDQGDTCTIGMQASSNGPFMLYSYDQENAVEQNMILVFNSNLGVFNKSIIIN